MFDDARGVLPADVAARAEFIQSDAAAAVGILASAAQWQADMVVVGAGLARRFQTGYVYSYALVMLVGLAAAAAWMMR